MKSKMKSAFAIIAVALMIMVAVVPMVSVFTEDSSATTKTEVDPSTDNNIITLNVNVVTTGSTTATVKIAYGSYSFTSTATGGNAEFKIREASVASLKISVVDANGVEDSTYPAVTLTNLVAGKTYGAALKSGYSSQSVKFQFDNGIDLAESNIGKAATITSTYTVYSDAAGTMQISTGQFVVNSDYTATFMVPAGTTGNVYVKVNSFSCSTVGAITFDPAALTTVNIGASAVALKAQQSLVVVSPNAAMNTDVMITAFKQTTTPTGGGSPTTIQFTPIKNTMKNGATDANARFIGIVPATTVGTSTYAMDLSADGSSATDVAVTVTITGGTSTYTLPATSFYGTVKMNSTYAQAGTLAADVYDSSTTPAKIGSVSATVDDMGNFFKFVTLTGTAATLKNVTFTSVGTTFNISDITWSSGTVNVIVPHTSTYSVVSGTFKLDGSTATDSIAGKQLTITGAKTFGSLFTTTSGFKFMAETGKNIIISATGAELYGGVSVVPGSSSENLDIRMKAQTLTLKVADALGTALAGATVKLTDGATDIASFETGTPAGTYTASIRGDLVATNYKVYIAGPSGYTFANGTIPTATAFVEGSTYKALESTYSIELYKSDGVTTAGAAADTDYKLFKAKAYKNSLGTFVYNYDDASDKITINTSGNKFVAKASAIAVKESDIGTTPVDVVVMVKENSLDNKGMFKNVYLINADSMGMVSIVASKDMLAAKLVRNDGVTGVPKIKVELYKGDVSTAANLVDTTYTQADGTFTLYSDLAITSTYKVKFTDGYSYYGFESAGYDAVTSAGKVAKFMPKTSTYEMSFYDADGTMIDVSTVNSVDIGGVTTSDTEDDYIYISANWTLATGTISISLKDSSGKEIRSFEKHALTAEELATGKITVKSLQKNYTFTVTDADGNAINGAYVNLYKYDGDYPVYKEQKTTNTMGKLTVAFPYIGDEGATYGYLVSSGDYAFPLDVTKITDVKIDVKSTSATKTVYLQDAAGVALKETPSSVYAVANDINYVATVGEGYFKYVATKDVKYTYSITMNTGSKYSFATKATDTDGVVKAKEQTVYGTVTDAGGLYFGKDVTIKAYNASGSVIGTEGKQKDTDMSYSMIVEKSKVSYYLAEDVTVSGAVKFTFEKSKTADIKAKETFVPIGFKTFNGKEIDSIYSLSTVSVMNDLGNLTPNTIVDVNDIPGIVVDTTDVSYYAVTFSTGTSDDYFDEGTYMSKDGMFVSDKALYEGKLGDASSTTSVEYAVYDGNTVIERGPVTDITAGKYTIKVDRTLGNKVVITQTVTVSGSTSTYTAVMDDKAMYNDLKMVVTEPELKARIVTNGHVGYVISADKTKVYLSADESYTMDATSSTGSKLVEKFVFDGWYVNGERVSGKLVYTVDNVESNIVLANYVSDGYYEMDKPASGNNGVSPTVLVIGIAAVIIALIAVVYVVVQKKE